MSELFYDVASIDYHIIDADAHVNAPPDLWQSRVPARLKQQAPQALHIQGTPTTSPSRTPCTWEPHAATWPVTS